MLVHEDADAVETEVATATYAQLRRVEGIGVLLGDDAVVGKRLKCFGFTQGGKAELGQEVL